jgi:hypothetical protein
VLDALPAPTDGDRRKTLKIKCWTAVLRNEGRVSSTAWCGRRLLGELIYSFFLFDVDISSRMLSLELMSTESQ